MSRTPSSDNLFLRGWANLRAGRVSLRSRLLLLSLLPALIIWLSALSLQASWHAETAKQADDIGHELSRQIANSLLDPLLADDQLSLNLQLAQWRQNPLIAHARLYGADNRVIAEAGRARSASSLAPGEGSFVASLQHQDNLVGRLHLSLAGEPFRLPLSGLLTSLSLVSLIVLLLAGLLAWQQGSAIRRVLRQLGNWSAEQDQPPAGIKRKDELGELAQQLAQRRIIDQPVPLLEDTADANDLADLESSTEASLDKPQPEDGDPPFCAIDLTAGVPEDDTEEHAETPATDTPAVDQLTDGSGEEKVTEPAPSASSTPLPAAPEVAEAEPESAVEPEATLLVLAIGLGNLEALQRLPRPRLLNLLERYRSHVQQAAKLYAGKLQSLEDGSSLIVFHSAQQPQEALTHALCCGELLRVLGHDLQIEIADTGLALHMQLALGEVQSDLASHELAHAPACEQVLEQVKHSRNLLLLDADMAEREAVRTLAVTRRLASQPEIYCVERLNEPYQSLLERQLNHLYQQRR
ncbi:MAG: histidine kinase [Pseudomonadaceae bacterium]|nr:MAG: histidine kinase [Pseudomonadaceae bacterium]